MSEKRVVLRTAGQSGKDVRGELRRDNFAIFDSRQRRSKGGFCKSIQRPGNNSTVAQASITRFRSAMDSQLTPTHSQVPIQVVSFAWFKVGKLATNAVSFRCMTPRNAD